MMWGAVANLDRNPENWTGSVNGEKSWDPHLRSTGAVRGYHIHAVDGEIGHIVDFLIEDESWAIRYIVVTTRNWWPGKHILIAIEWIDRVSWNESRIFVSLTRDEIRKSPEYLASTFPSKDYEQELHAHYHRPLHGVDALKK
jgi:hypothetical protein